MSATREVTTDDEFDDGAAPGRAWFWRWLRQSLPFTAMIVLGIVGAAWTSFTMRPAVGYWVVLAPVFGVICIVAGWRHFTTGGARLRLVVMQVLSWVACLVAMYLTLLPEVRGVMNDNAAGLGILTLLAFATFVAGLLAREWRVCVVGAFLALAVPISAWLEHAVLALLLVALVLLALGAIVWRFEQGGRPAQAG